MVLWRQAAALLLSVATIKAQLQTSKLPNEDYSYLCTGVVDYEYVIPQVSATYLQANYCRPNA